MLVLDASGSTNVEAGPDQAQPCVMKAGPTVVHLSIHDDVPALEREWRAFEQRADCTVFQTFGWVSAWQRHIGLRNGVRPAVVIGRDAQGAILFLLPLSVEKRGFTRRLMWLGSGVSDYNAPLMAPAFSRELGSRRFLALWPEILARIQEHRCLRFDLVHFICMPETVGVQENPFCRLPVTTHPSGIYLTHLAGDWETFYAAKRSPATRRRDRTKRNRLREIGDVKLVTPETTEEIASSFDKLIVQKTRSFAAMGVGNIFGRPGHSEFYRSVATDPSTRHIAHLSRLDVGPVAAAINLGLRFRGRYYHMLASYDDGDLSRFGPGAAHLHELMRHAIESGCHVFDFTVGDEPYKRDWSDAEAALFDHVSAAGWHGAFSVAALLAQIRVKRFIKQTPVFWKIFSRARALFGRVMPEAAPARRMWPRTAGVELSRRPTGESVCHSTTRPQADVSGEVPPQ